MATILIIEDNYLNMKLAIMLLRTARHDTIQAVDAESGLALARDRQPDLVLLDIQLPGMDGLTATRCLKDGATTRHIPVIAMTALAMKGDEERILAAGCDAYVAKPLDYRVFLSTVAQLLTRRGLAWQPSSS